MGARIFIVMGVICGGFGIGCTTLYYLGKAEVTNRKLATLLHGLASA
jgi:hypothetical protein